MSDPDRQLRFLYPPFFMLASLLLGIYFDPNVSLKGLLVGVGWSGNNYITAIGILVAGASAVVVPIGFLIGTITILVIRLIFLAFNEHYESVMSDESIARVSKYLGIKDSTGIRIKPFAAITFDHDVLPKSIHDWAMRRWITFTISANSFTALLFALGFGKLLSIAICPQWFWLTVFGCSCLLVSGSFAWHDCMNMIEFQSRRPLEQFKKLEDK